MKKITNIYQKIGEIGLELFFLNIYWILFTIIGGIVFGLFPATIAVYSCIRHKLTYGYYKEKSFRLFKDVYKNEFFKSNKMALVLYLMWLIIYIDFNFLSQFDMGLVGNVVSGLLVAISLILFLMNLYLFPIYVHFKGNIRSYIKRSFALIIGKPKESLVSLSMAAILIVLYYNLPGLVPVFGITLYAYVSLRIVLVDVFDFKVTDSV